MGLIFLFYPFLEGYAWYLFVERYSFLDAVGIVLTGVALGLIVMLLQGRVVLATLQKSLAQGQVPTGAVVHRGLIMLGGFLIFLPGLLSKFSGIILILPGFRHLAVWFFRWYLAGKIANGTFRVYMSRGMGNADSFGAESFESSRDVIEAVPTSIEHKDK